MSRERNIGADIGPIFSEFKEQDPGAEYKWFAGAFEAGGVMAFGIQRKKNGYVASYPYISFREPNEPFITLLKARYSGSKKPRGNSWEWRLTGYKAAEIASEMEPFVVSRKETVLAMQNWLGSDTPERVQIAESMKGYDRFRDGSVEDYAKLVRDPAFVAGVLDNRGTVYPHSEGNYIYPRIEARSKNKNLLDALQEKFGGLVDILVEKGTISVIQGKAITTQTDSFVWNVSNAQARELIELAREHIKIVPYEGWDKRRINEARETRGDQVIQLELVVQEELEKFGNGEITRLSTAQELAERFSLSLKTARRRIASLPADVKLQREAIIRSTNKRVLTEGYIAAVVESIQKEIEEYLQGKITKLSYNDDWANQSGVGVHIIDRNVISRLPENVRNLRQHLLYSQATKERNEKYGNPSKK